MDKLLENKVIKLLLLLILIVGIAYSIKILVSGFTGEGTFVENITGKEYDVNFEIYLAERQSDENKSLQSEFLPGDPILIVIYNDSKENVEIVYVFSGNNGELQRITIPIPSEDYRTISAPSDLATGEYTIEAFVGEQNVSTTNIRINENSN